MAASQPTGALRRILLGLPLAILAPVFLLFVTAVLLLTDLFSKLIPKKPLPPDHLPNTNAASIVIPNWNGRDLLEKYLPSVEAAAARVPGSEIIVVDNGSEDGSADYLRAQHPRVRVIALPKNLGFGGGSNQGFLAAKHDIVVLLNSDMRVEPGFLAPLLAGFTDAQVFSVSCQIYLSDPTKRREETGLTEGWWQRGSIRLGHRIDPEIKTLFPCFYAGGGSSAYDRHKFLELGAFDPLLEPFYLEDTDLGYLSWKRGWKNFYQPASVVYHEHRGTIGRKFSTAYIHGVLKKNYLLYTWKNIHATGRFLEHIFFSWAGAMMTWLTGDSPERSSLAGIARATLQLPAAVRSRFRARQLAAITDDEVLLRTQAGYFRDRFPAAAPKHNLPHVLFIAPYPICPPNHGGGVFMNQTVQQLAGLTELHVIILLENAQQEQAHAELQKRCASMVFTVRTHEPRTAPGSLLPHAVREFRRADIHWLIHKQIYLHDIDVLQIEYTALAQYGERFKRIVSILFEHDIYFQSVARRIPFIQGLRLKIAARWEYLAALRYELRVLPGFDRVQVCSADNRQYMQSFLPEMQHRIDEHYRAGIDPSRYPFADHAQRQPFTMLFLGSFRHTPNLEALDWFARLVLPLVLQKQPSAKLVVVGSDPPARHPLAGVPGVEFAGFAEDLNQVLASYAVFVCPILSGSGVRVKLLEAFAAGIPVVSTPLGAEGLANRDGDICALAESPEGFAQHVLQLFENPAAALEMAVRARRSVETSRDIRKMTAELMECYRAEIHKKSRANSSLF